MQVEAEREQLADGTPVRLGRYRLLRPISTGGMARVFEARREGLAGVAPRVAIKVILPDYARHDGFQRLFIHEARVGSMLAHPNLVQIQDFDIQDERYFLVMEFVEGITLRRAISLCRRHGIPVPVHVVAEIGRQVCDGLAHAHQATAEDGQPLALVHRDIKPGNLMINPQGLVKLLDFGISKAHLLAEREGAVRGTWGYMPPEQASGSAVGPAADLFGLAAVLYELAVLQPLFPEKEPEQIRALLDRDEAVRRASALTGPFNPLARVLMRALQRDPAARFDSAAAMGRALSEMIVDPVTARDRLVRFQREIQARADAAAEGRPTGASTTPTGPSAPSLSGAAAQGLPVAVGDAQGPKPVVDLRARAAAEGEPARPIPWGRLLMSALGMGVVGFTAWQLFIARPSPPAAAPERRPVAALAGLEGSEPAASRSGVPPTGAAVSAPSAPTSAPTSASAPRTATARASSSGGAGAPASGAATASSPTSPPAASPTPTAGTARVGAAATTAPMSVAPAGAGPAGTGPASAEVAALLPVAISSEPRAEVLVDKEPRGRTPLIDLNLSPGRHAVTLESVDGRRATFTIDVAEGARNTWVYDFEARGFR